MKKLTQYDHKKIEAKILKQWEKKKVYKTKNPSASSPRKSASLPRKCYVLDMFPYPSGAGLHVGHPRGYIASDVFARLKRMQGYNVLHPMGFDSFGLPAEQYAIKTGKNPGPFTDTLVKQYRKQLEIIGFSYDWDKMIATHDPSYYKWTQWIFLQLYNSWYDKKKNCARDIKILETIFSKEGNKNVEAECSDSTSLFSKEDWKKMSSNEREKMLMNYRLSYQGYSEVNWCEELGTVLANDEIIDGPSGPVSERGEHPVTKKMMRQWFMRITAYADRLLNGLDGLDWNDNIKEIQRNWIGKSEGSEIDFKLVASSKSLDAVLKVFTTRADTLFGVTYVVLAPEHTLVERLKKNTKNIEEVEEYIARAKLKDIHDRTDISKEKSGVILDGVFAINPANGEEVPVWIADYVLASYGTGAVMAVPSHDKRDFEFAEKYGLEKKCVVEPSGSGMDLETLESFLVKVVQGKDCYLGEEGKLINSGDFDKLSTHEARIAITKKVGGRIVTKYKMRDAIFARQRYWGEPIPLVHKKDGTISEVKSLPLKLPNVKSYAPSGTGESPLATVSSWVKSGYETNTMPGWAGSSWYFLRYMDPKNKKAFADKKAIAYWKDVDMYVGGQEHATGHLLYSRFWHKFLKDMGYVPTEEPFKALRNQGFVIAQDGRKMSKRWGNVINPDDIVKTYGADTLRVYESFMGPFDQMVLWNTDSIMGPRRFLERVWRTQEKVVKSISKETLEKYNKFESLLHKTTEKVQKDIEGFSFNTSISALMILQNQIDDMPAITKDDYIHFIKLLSPFAPFMTEEIWENLGMKNSIHQSEWPKVNKKKIAHEGVTIGIQVNGKVRSEITLDENADEDEVKNMILQDPKIIAWLLGKEIKKFVYVKGRIINIVVG
ncbi:MAG: leucine--tRNA ligase [Candidatus Pacebacteria bacterium]|nr:leucine--tRNA ligase [Candidatus Paceibacterota bacterium]